MSKKDKEVVSDSKQKPQNVASYSLVEKGSVRVQWYVDLISIYRFMRYKIAEAIDSNDI